jgi:asparagine N-glycosylation enzyme membrane subunit Stt3
MRIASAVLVVLLAFAFGCGPMLSEGTRIDASKADKIVKNKTSAQEVEALFGKPYKVEKMGGGKETYIYYYKYEEYVHWNTLPKTTEQKLEVDILNGVVTDYTWNRTSVDPMRDSQK